MWSAAGIAAFLRDRENRRLPLNDKLPEGCRFRSEASAEKLRRPSHRGFKSRGERKRTASAIGKEVMKR